MASCTMYTVDGIRDSVRKPVVGLESSASVKLNP